MKYLKFNTTKTTDQVEGVNDSQRRYVSPVGDRPGMGITSDP
jgi:hypothetical protein